MKRHERAGFVFLALLALAAPVFAQAAERQFENVEGRDEWFWGPRSFPFGTRPYEQMAQLRINLPSMMSRYTSASSTPPLGGSWRPIGPYGLWDPSSGFFGSGGQFDAGRVASIVPSVTPGGPMYIGTASGGVWQSADQGVSWKSLTDNECALTTGAVAVDPVLPSRVYVGTGEGNGSRFGCGVLRSSDGGNSWTSTANGLGVSGGGTIFFYNMVVDAATAGTTTGTTLIAGVGFSSPNGIARSTNSGATWTTVQGANVGVVTSIVAHPTKPSTYYAGARAAPTAAQRGVYRSTDAGLTWSQIAPLPVADPTAIGRVELAVSKASPGLLWAIVSDVSVANSGKLLGLFRYDETTNAWTQLAANGVVTNGTSRGDFGTQGSYDLVIAVDPRDPQKIFLAGVRAYRSVDGGASFQPMAMEIHCDWHVLVFDRFNPDIMWAGTDGGVFQSTDAGNSWTARNTGLAISQMYPGVAIHPKMTRVLAGLQDNGTVLYTGSLFWDGTGATGDGGYNAINYNDPNIQWYESYWSKGSAPFVVRRQGTSSSLRVNGITISDRAAFFPPFVLDPVNPSKLYLGSYRLYRTTDEGLNWTPISPDLTSGSGTISSISVSPGDTNTIYVGTSDGLVQVSRDGGLTWKQATGLPARSVTRVTAHPTDPLRALITTSGFQAGHVFETQDAFATPVKNITGALVDAPANVGIYIADQNVIAIGTDVGVFQSADGGASWSLGPAGLPNVIVMDLVYQQATGLLAAATFGRGMWVYNVGTQTAVLRGDVNGDGKVDAADALIVQQALAAASSQATAVYPRGDANCNNAIDAADLVVILRAAVGLPTGSACVGTVR